MPVIQAYHVGDVLVQIDNINLPPSLFEMDPIDIHARGLIGPALPATLKAGPSPVPSRVVTVHYVTGFADDWFNRIHIVPTEIALGTFASTQTRQVEVWNAWIEQPVTLTEILKSNASGISIQGPAVPHTFKASEVQFWTFSVTTSGPPVVDAGYTWTFTNVPNSATVSIIGFRSTVFPFLPEVPVQEQWQWLTDIGVAFDGSEQRISLRMSPRRSQTAKTIAANEDTVREQYRLLLTTGGRLFVPYFQWAAPTKAKAGIGDTALLFNSARTDLREGEYAAIRVGEKVALVQLGPVSASGAALIAPLAFEVLKGSQVIPVFNSIVDNNQTLQRYAVNSAGELSISSTAIETRLQFERPGSTATLTRFDGYPVLERRPTMDGMLGHEFDTGQELLDNKTGILGLRTDWKFTKVQQSLTFSVHRVMVNPCGRSGPDEMDYWRKFFNTIRGMAKPFLTSSYRADCDPLVVSPAMLILAGASYVESYYPIQAYRRLALTTDAGVHYCKVISAGKTGEGHSQIDIAPPLPAGAGWETVRMVSYLMKLRLASDNVDLRHTSLQTVFNFNVRTIEE